MLPAFSTGPTRPHVRASASGDPLAHPRGEPGAGDGRHRAAHVLGAVALVADDVEGAVLDLVVDAPDVLADDAEGDQLDAAEQQDRDRQGAEAREVGAGEVQRR